MLGLTDGELIELGFSISGGDGRVWADDSAGEPTQWEDMSAAEARWRRRRGTSAACRLDCERGLPPAGATGDALAAYQQEMLGRGKA